MHIFGQKLISILLAFGQKNEFEKSDQLEILLSVAEIHCNHHIAMMRRILGFCLVKSFADDVDPMPDDCILPLLTADSIWKSNFYFSVHHIYFRQDFRCCSH